MSNLSHSIVFFYFFALINEEGFLISPLYSLEFCIQIGISFTLIFHIIVLAYFVFTLFLITSNYLILFMFRFTYISSNLLLYYVHF